MTAIALLRMRCNRCHAPWACTRSHASNACPFCGSPDVASSLNVLRTALAADRRAAWLYGHRIKP